MADPNLLPEGAGLATAAAGGGGGLVFILGKLADRWFSKSDKDAGKLDQILAAVQALNGRLDVMSERQTTTRADVDKLEAGVLALQLGMAELKGRLDHLSEQLVK